MKSDSVSSGYWSAEWTFRYLDTEKMQLNVNKRTKGTKKKRNNRQTNITYVVPVHFPDELVPLITSQYWPSGSEVENSEFQTESSLLIATNPRAPQKKNSVSNDKQQKRRNRNKPRPKAICCGCGDTQLVIGADPTALRNPTMPLIAVSRCWQYQPPVPPLLLQVPDPVVEHTHISQRTSRAKLTHHCWEHRHHSLRMSNWTERLVCRMDALTRRCLRWCIY